MRTYQQMADLMCHHIPQKPSRASIRFMVEFLDGIVENVDVSSGSVGGEERHSENVFFHVFSSWKNPEIQVGGTLRRRATAGAHILLPDYAVDPRYLQTRGHEYPARFLLGEFNDGARRCRVIEDADGYRDDR